MRKRTRLITGALLTAAMLATASAALAVHPTKGATYAGSWGPKSAGGTIQFKVSSNGKSVSGFKIGLVPLGCQGANPLAKSGGHATVSNNGTFSLSLVMYFPPTKPGRHVGTLVVTGKFAGHNKESGKLASKFTGSNGYRKSCDKSVSYSAKG